MDTKTTRPSSSSSTDVSSGNPGEQPDLVSALVRIGNIFSTERNFNHLLQTIVNETNQILNAERGSIFLVEGEQLWSKIATGLAEEEIIRVKKNEGIAGKVVSTGMPLIIPDAYQDTRFNPLVDKETGYKTHTLLCVPLISTQGEVIGAFELLNKRTGTFTSYDQEVLKMVASQAAIAIENIQLYEKEVERKDTLEQENITLKAQLKGKYAYPAIVGDSPAILQVKNAIHKVSATEANVLIRGESGTGKELIARSIHSQSPRANRPFVAINCAALPDSLMESELFGIEKGVATGVNRRVGLLEQAKGGTLFMDEVGEMPLSTQVKLLRVLQERTFMRIGGNQEIQLDIRVIGATNRDLEAAIEQGEFREDLYYRLNVFPILIPPLRERGDDIIMLARFILSNAIDKMKVGKKIFNPECETAMMTYPWPGNVRELENIIERAVILSEGETVDVCPLLGVETPSVSSSRGALAKTASLQPAKEGLDLRSAVEEVELDLIQRALKETGGNQLQAAKRLGLSREGLRKKMVRLNLTAKE
ncbi:MAG: sigma 54-interacting transcriptional regulator [Deltaproteobacteria bacterium]|nr:sigma 54-interacting transcriptional regulator [Deltaproteobacteria bacterium]